MTRALTTDDIRQGNQLPNGRDTRNNDITIFYDTVTGDLSQTPTSRSYQIQDWSAKTFQKDPQLVFSPTDKSKIYRLNTYDNTLGGQVSLPFSSTDFATELVADKWKLISGGRSIETGITYISTLSELDEAISGAVSGDWAIIGDITLDANKTIPADVTLIPRGGIITFGTFDLIGTNTKIAISLNKLFEYDSTGRIAGTWSNDRYTPQTFGARGDNLTDDTASFQACSDAIKQTGGEAIFLIPSGFKYLVDTINLPKDLNSKNLLISGYGATLRTTSQGTIFNRSVADQSEASTIVSEKYRIEGLRFDGPFFAVDPALEAFRAINLEALYSASIVDCSFLDFGTGIDLKFCLNTEIDNPFFENCVDNFKARTGASVWTGATLTNSQSNNCIVNKPTFKGHNSGISHSQAWFRAVSGCRIKDPIFEGGNPEYGVLFNAESSTVVKEFRVENIHLENVPTTAWFEIQNMVNSFFEIDGMYNQVAATILSQGTGAVNNNIFYKQYFNQANNRFNVDTASIVLEGDLPSDIVTNPVYWNGVFPTSIKNDRISKLGLNVFYEIESPNGQISNAAGSVGFIWGTNNAEIIGGGGGIKLTGKILSNQILSATGPVGNITSKIIFYNSNGSLAGFTPIYDAIT